TTFSQIASLPANTTTYSNVGLTVGTKYNYRVRAYASTGSKYSSYSNTASATTPACTYSLSPTSNTSVGSAGGGYSVTVTGGTGCGWTATSSATWLTITAGASGSGNGSVSYSCAANTNTTSRSASLTIAGQSFAVTQAAG